MTIGTLLIRRLTVALIAIVVLLGACTQQGPQKTPEKISLKLATRPFLLNLPFYIAREEGFFADMGLEVEFVTIGQGLISEVIPPLTSGDIHVAAAIPTFGLFNAIRLGADVQVVAEKGYIPADPDKCADTAVLARKDLVESGQLKTPNDLKGRKVGATLDTADGYQWSELLKTGGLTLGEVEFVPLPLPARVDALLGGSIDLTTVQEPQVTSLLETGKVVVWRTLKDIRPDSTNGVVVFGPELLKRNKGAGDRFLAAFLRGVRQHERGPTERNLEIAAKETEIEVERLREVCWSPMRPMSEISWDWLEGFQEYGRESGFLEEKIAEDQFWTDDFLVRARRILDERGS